ncbi:MAG TPA: decaprenyl-phosphate phosphoribosyltransferase [Solirubrobacteraceae bacterium]|nr:decaprenyl-phosphate phosphoribosyltransferase [Solirubrobacteraceae bacterium]
MRACRPQQWLKNTVVLIAPAAAGAISRPGAGLALVGAFVAFCLISSATYLINDVRDRAADRRHPRKRLRPVAAGQLSPGAALEAAVALALAAVVAGVLVRSALALVVLGYGALTLSYTLWWRDIVLIDMFAVAGCFVLRAVAGGAAVDVSLSRPFLVVTSACALFLVVGKRHAEFLGPGRSTASRATLRRYSRRGLWILLAGSAILGVVAYADWSFTRPALGPWLALSLIPFGLWLTRYAALVNEGAGEAPEALVLRDHALLALSLIWAVLFTAGIYGSR